jgi:hypothetical protein
VRETSFNAGWLLHKFPLFPYLISAVHLFKLTASYGSR